MKTHNEAAFESAIEAFLTSPSGGYISRPHTAFDRTLCLDSDVFVTFVQTTQPEEWAYLVGIHKDDARDVLVKDLVHALDIPAGNALSVLRHGFKCFGKLIRAAYFAPASGLNPDTERLYRSNVFAVVRQVRYSTKHENSVGVVLTLRGIPVVTIELKNRMTGQTWSHAIHQYRHDRDPAETLFAFGRRALVHFAVDTDEAHMAPRIEGVGTRFLPFNRGRNSGAGNPDNPGGYRTAYLWEEVLRRESLLDIIARFLHLQADGSTRTLIFPRYHQLTAVRRLISAARSEGTGRNYLIQHSAGSGKSNSIARRRSPQRRSRQQPRQLHLRPPPQRHHRRPHGTRRIHHDTLPKRRAVPHDSGRDPGETGVRKDSRGDGRGGINCGSAGHGPR